MSIFDQYKLSGALRFLADFRTGSLVDTVNGTAPAIAGSPKLVRGRGGLSLNAPSAADMISYGSGANYDLTDAGTIVTVFRVPAAALVYLTGKFDFGAGNFGYLLYQIAGVMVLALASGVGARSDYALFLTNVPPHSLVHLSASWSASKIYATMNGVPAASQNVVDVSNSAGFAMRPINFSVAPEGVLFAAIMNVTTTDQERAAIYDSWRLEGHV